MSAAIEVHDVSFSYGGPLVLEHVDLAIETGEFFGLVGPNGGGKSTLLKIILGLLHPQAGRVQVLGASPEAARRRIGYCAQHVRFAREFPITVEQVVLLGRLGRTPRFGGWSREDRRRAGAALSACEIAHLARRPLANLSGGELQRVLIARALACDPELLILDESTANVDHHAGVEIFELLRRLSSAMTIIVVSHDIGFISSYVTRVGCINRTLETHATTALTAGVLERLYAQNLAAIDHAHH